jgi:hypothetical protein
VIHSKSPNPDLWVLLIHPDPVIDSNPWWSASAVAVLINTKLDITRSITDALNNLKKDNRKPLAKRQYPTIIST